jgi:hypothetical protein
MCLQNDISGNMEYRIIITHICEIAYSNRRVGNVKVDPGTFTVIQMYIVICHLYRHKQGISVASCIFPHLFTKFCKLEAKQEVARSNA